MATIRSKTTATIEPTGEVDVETTCTATPGASNAASITVPPAFSVTNPPKVFGYGTAGFREKATVLAPVMFRVGILAALRSLKKRAKIGVMITASHNPEPDNGAKIVDPMGEMLEASWEAYATAMANCKDCDIDAEVARIRAAEDIPSGVASVVVARDTRPSGPELMDAAIAGIEAVQKGATLDCGVLTTPQLHYIVRCHNDPAYGEPTEEGYVAKFSAAFRALLPAAAPKIKVNVDCANGVGAPKFATVVGALEGVLEAAIANDGSAGVLNEGCGADYVKTNQTAPKGMHFAEGDLCASFDGDADRLMFFFKTEGGAITILDGDRIAILCALFLNDRLAAAKLSGIKLGVVQTAYANGGSTQHLERLGIPTACSKTGVKHLHHLALQYDVGVYFEANGHGTVLFSDAAKATIKAAHAELAEDDVSPKAAAVRDLQAAVDLINQAVGDAISDLLLVLAILAKSGMDATKWAALYSDLPNRLLKVKIKDRTVVKTTNAERTCTAPEGMQAAVDAAVAKFSNARSFVRPSGTEDVVRVYAEAATGDEAVALAAEVCQLVFDRCEGIPPPPASAQFVDEIDATTVHSLSVLEKVVGEMAAALEPHLATVTACMQKGEAVPLEIATKLTQQSRLITRLKTQQAMCVNEADGVPRRTLSKPGVQAYERSIVEEHQRFVDRLAKCAPGSAAEAQMQNYVQWAQEEIDQVRAMSS